MKTIHLLLADLYFQIYIWNRNGRWLQKYLNHERRARTG